MVAMLGLGAACDDDEGGTAADSGGDSSNDAAGDAALDGTPDATPDATADPDGLDDAAADAVADEGTGDASADSGSDVEEDVVENGSVAWSDELPNPYILPDPNDPGATFGGVGVDWFLQWTVEQPEPNEPLAVLDLRICSQPAGEEESCDDTPLGAAADGGIRWGLDPSQYNVGLNLYSHTLTMSQGETVIDVATLSWEVTADSE